MQFQNQSHQPSALSVEKAPQRISRQDRIRRRRAASEGSSNTGMYAVIDALSKESTAQLDQDQAPKRVFRQLSAGSRSRGEQSLKIARRRFHQKNKTSDDSNDIDAIIDNLPKDMAAKLDLLNDEEEEQQRGSSSGLRRSSTRSSWLSRMSSISTTFSSMKSIIVVADLEDEDDQSLDLSSFPKTLRQKQDKGSQPPRLPWRQSSCPSVNGNSSKASSARKQNKKTKSKDTRPKKPWRQGGSFLPQLRLPGIQRSPAAQQVEPEHDASATLRMSATSDFTFAVDPLASSSSFHQSNHSASDRELSLPVRRESLSTIGSQVQSRDSISPSATTLEKKSFLKRQLKFPIKWGKRHNTQSHGSW